MSSWKDTRQFLQTIGLDEIPSDLYVPDGTSHIVYLELVYPPGVPIIPIVLTSSQWDFTYWIWRLSESESAFEIWLGNFLSEMFQSYIEKKMKE